MSTSNRLAQVPSNTPSRAATTPPLSAPMPLSPELLRHVSGAGGLPKGGW